MDLKCYLQHQLAKGLERFESSVLSQRLMREVSLHCFSRVIYIRIECCDNPFFSYLREKDPKLLYRLHYRIGIDITERISMLLENLLEISIVDSGFSFSENGDMAVFAVFDSVIDSHHPLGNLLDHQDFAELKQPVTELYVAHHKRCLKKGPKQVTVYTGDNFVLVHAITEHPLCCQLKSLNINASMAVAAFYRDTIKKAIDNLHQAAGSDANLRKHSYFSAVSYKGDSVFLVCEFSENLARIAQSLPPHIELNSLLNKSTLSQ